MTILLKTSAEMGLTFDDVALVIQWNKRDLPNALSVDELEERLNPKGYPTAEAIARDGKGVFPTLKLISKLVIDRLNKEHAPATKRRRTGTGTNSTTGEARAATPNPALLQRRRCRNSGDAGSTCSRARSSLQQ